MWEGGFMPPCLWLLLAEGVVGGSTQSLHHIEGWSLTPESLEGHRLICILAQRRPPGDPKVRWDRVERLAAFRRSSLPVQGERESTAALIVPAGEKKKKDKTQVKTLVRTLARGRWERENEGGGGSGKRSQCFKLVINDRLEVWEGCVFVSQR